MFWVSPLQYAMTGLTNNEYLGDSYRKTDFRDAKPGSDTQLGEAVLDLYGFLQGNKWRCAPLRLVPVMVLHGSNAS
jgi:hypothetical protein